MALEHPVYVLVGSEAVQRRYLLGRLKQQAGEWERVDLSKTEMIDLMQPSLLASPDSPLVRVVAGYSALKPAARKQLAAGIEEMGEGLHLAICVDRLGGKDPIRAAVPEEAVVSLAAPKRGQFEAWLTRQARLFGVGIDQTGAQEMVERIGEDTEALASELLRISATGNINADTVRRLTPKSSSTQAWGWVDALAEGKDGARELKDCEESGIEPLMMLGALAKRLTLVAWVKKADKESSGAADYPWKLAGQLAKRTSDSQLRHMLLMVAKAEQQLKGQSLLEGYTVLARLGQEIAYSPSSNT